MFVSGICVYGTLFHKMHVVYFIKSCIFVAIHTWVMSVCLSMKMFTHACTVIILIGETSSEIIHKFKLNVLTEFWMLTRCMMYCNTKNLLVHRNGGHLY